MKKSKNLNPGYIFCPYIMVNNVMKINEDVFSPSKAINSRYAKTMVNGAYYGSILKDTRNNKRKKKLENIFEVKNPTE